ncbi:MAG: HEAT repeat domain-containing protein [Gemmatimonadetes bacterium]|nr:HEAT repeat domain-containing protein [Gemmatimonadota bacterium]
MRKTLILALPVALLLASAPTLAQVERHRAADALEKALHEQRAALERHAAGLARLHASGQLTLEQMLREQERVQLQLGDLGRHFEQQQLELHQLGMQRHDLELEQALQHEMEQLSRHIPGLHADAFNEALDGLYGEGPAASWAPQDSADALWRQGREHLNARRYRDAVRSFSRIRTESRFANSPYRADANYWEAYALSRLGGEEDLEQARTILETLLRFPPSQRTPDADGLMVTVQSRLARLGNRDAERALVATATPRGMYVEQADLARAVAEQAVVVNEARATFEQARIAGQQAAIAYADAVPPGLFAPGVFLGDVVWSAALPGSIPQQCRTDQEEIRMVALNALTRLDAASAAPILREVMARRGECSEYLRRQALTIAAQHKTPEAAALLVDAARNDPDRSVRVTALQLLVQVDEERALGLIEERLRNTADTTALQEALSATGRGARNDRIARALTELAARNDAPVSIRRGAILALSRRQDAVTQTALRQLYRQTDERRLREAILAVAATADADGTDWLLGIAGDPQENEATRRAALMRAARGDAVGIDRLAGLYDRFTEPSMKAAVIETLSMRARSDRGATDKLLSIARTETDTRLRKQAILALSHTDDPRVRDMLMEIVRR